MYFEKNDIGLMMEWEEILVLNGIYSIFIRKSVADYKITTDS